MAVTSFEPQVSVQSRVSWGALLAGAAVGVATYTVLALLGVAVGLSVADSAALEDVGTGAGIWAFVSLLIAMFFAGWVTTQCTIGETQTEAMLYGVVVWAVTATFLMWSAASGIRLGQATIAIERSAVARMAPPTTDGGGATSTDPPSTTVSPRVDSVDRGRLQVASWWTFIGTILSLVAAVGGAMLGPYEFVARRSTRGRIVTNDIPERRSVDRID
jgi:hypothetical protein